MQKKGLWCRDYSILILATTIGSIGGIAGSYAMSFLVFDETGSTFATGFLTALQVVPHFLVPVLIAPWMDRMPRKPILVGGDFLGGILYGLVAIYLHKFRFSYAGYLVFSLVINCVNALDSLAYNCIFPKVIPEGFEDRGFTVSAMLYPVLNVLMMPLSAIMMDTIGVANILLLQSGLSILAAITENCINLEEKREITTEKSGFSLWLQDFKSGINYLKGEKGLLNIYAYDAFANGAYAGIDPIMVAFFRTAPGFSAKMYAFFSAAEFIGRTIGGMFRYQTNMKPEHRRNFVYSVQQFYNLMNGVLLWLPYPSMLINRGICGFLGINSATVRISSIHRYLPEEYRARVNAFSDAAISITGSLCALLFGAIGEVLNYRITMTMIACMSMVVCWFTVGRNKDVLNQIYLYQTEECN